MPQKSPCPTAVHGISEGHKFVEELEEPGVGEKI